MSGMDDTDLANLSPEEAREYVLAFVTTLKQTTKARGELGLEIESWRSRLALAREKGATDLADKAATILAGLEEKDASLETEERELRDKTEVLKRKLRELTIKGSRLVDTDLLQAELEMAVGEEKSAEISAEEAMKELQAQQALEALKRKLGGGGQAPG